MKKIFYLSMCLLAGAASITGCSKDEDVKLTRTQMLAGSTSKNWVVTSSKEDGVETFGDWEACDKDDLYTFFANKSFKNTEGATKCSASSPDEISSGTWSFSADEKQLTVDGFTETIVEISNSKLVLESTDDGIKYTTTLVTK